MEWHLLRIVKLLGTVENDCQVGFRNEVFDSHPEFESLRFEWETERKRTRYVREIY
jgi:uncharacterized protein YecE (DUF72 family)